MTSTAPAPRRKRRSPEEIMDRILQAAGEEFERAGYAGATTASIARAADVTEAQLFRYFASKAELFREAIFRPLNRHFVEFQSRHVAEVSADRSHRGLAHEYIAELQDFAARHSRMLLSLVVAQTYSPDSSEGLAELDGLSAYFDRGATMMASRVGDAPRVDPQLMVRVSFAAVLANVMFKDWLFPAGLASDAAIGEAISDFVIDGINANNDPQLEK